MATVDTLLVRIEADMSQLKNQLSKTQSVTNNVTTGIKSKFAQVGVASNALANQFSLLKTAILGLGVGFLANSVIKANSEMEDLQRTLTTVMGTAKQGEAAFKFINIFAQRTPFDIQTLTRAFIQLKGAGIAPTEKLLTTLGNAASVTTDKIGAFESLVRITTRAVGGGLGLEELEQLVTKGIPVYKILEDELGITRAGVTELGKSAEGAAKIMNALNRSFDTRFPNAMAEASGNMSVQLSNLGIAINNAFLAIGESGLNKEIKNTVVALTDATTSGNSFLKVVGTTLANSLKFLRENFKNLIATIGGLVALKTVFWAVGTTKALINMGIAIVSLTRLTTIFGAVSRVAFSKKGMLGLLAIGTIVTTFKDNIADMTKQVKELFPDIGKHMKDVENSFKEFFGISGLGFKNLDNDLKKFEEKMNEGVSKSVANFTGDISKMREEFEKLQPSSVAINQRIEELELLLDNMNSNNSIGQFNADIANTKVVLEDLKGRLKETEPMFMAIKDAAVTAGNSISDTFAEALVNGKMNLNSIKDIFKSFVTQIISQAIRLMVVNKIINSIFGFTGQQALPTANIGGKKAGGGTVQARTPVMVGERGPELFIPNTGGVVKNNMDTKGMVGGGNPVVINQSINISTGVAQTVRAEVMNLMPQITRSTTSAILDAKQRGGSFATIMS